MSSGPHPEVHPPFIPQLVFHSTLMDNTAHVIITAAEEIVSRPRLCVHLALVSPLPMLPCSRCWMFLLVRHYNPRGITNRCAPPPPPPPPSTCHSLHNITVTGFNDGVLMTVRTTRRMIGQHRRTVRSAVLICNPA